MANAFITDGSSLKPSQVNYFTSIVSREKRKRLLIAEVNLFQQEIVNSSPDGDEE